MSRYIGYLMLSRVLRQTGPALDESARGWMPLCEAKMLSLKSFGHIGT
jgi:hypothetical protein